MSNSSSSGCGWLVAAILFAGVMGAIKEVVTDSSKKRTASATYHVSSSNWYDGGTLQKATIGEWRRASDANKLATCASWIDTFWRAGETTINYGSIEDMKKDAEWLREELNAAVSGSGTRDSDSVTEVAVLMMIMMKLIEK